MKKNKGTTPINTILDQVKKRMRKHKGKVTAKGIIGIKPGKYTEDINLCEGIALGAYKEDQND